MMESIFALISFSFVMSITPGPNNILLMSSGLRFGLKRTLPHIFGIQFGLATQLILSAYGFGLLILQSPTFSNGLRILGTSYLLYLTWSLSRLQFSQVNTGPGRPFTLIQAALFQFVNPKAWMMAVTAGSLLIPQFETQWLSIAMLCVIFSMIGMPSSGSWAVFGTLLGRYLQSDAWRRGFNTLLMVLTLFTAVTIWT